jgi:spore germination cell wall hydrolase CwlJ-like protein
MAIITILELAVNTNRLTAGLGFVAIGLLVILVVMVYNLTDRTNAIDERLGFLEHIIKTETAVSYTQKDLDCLAKNIYYEAGNQDDVGKYAVATVTLNRLKSGRWGNTVCRVVYSPAQFSWTLLKRLRSPDPEIYARGRAIAQHALNGYRVKGLEKSLLYHADYIRDPNWADQKNKIGKIGAHIFYTKGKGSTIDI